MNTTPQNNHIGSNRSDYKNLIILTLSLLGVSLVVFRILLFPNILLFTTDDNIGALALTKRGMPQSFFGWWSDSNLLGVRGILPISWTFILLWLLPLEFFSNWIHAIDLFLASLFLALFLRKRGCSWLACFMGALTAFWIGSNLTLTYAGHISKFGVLMFASLSLWLIQETIIRRSPWWAILAGGAIGGMYIEQADVGLFFCLVLIPYSFFAYIQQYGMKLSKCFILLLPFILAFGLNAIRPIWEGYETFVKGVSAVQTENSKSKWEFITQWSWPPEESIDFIAPGYMGWRSQEPDGPYWGRMGQTANWEKTKQGFRNFKLENQYIGVIPLLLAFWASLNCLKNGNLRSPIKVDARFWCIASVLTLLLSFGKYFPLYQIFYLLPGVSSIRNPNKFLQIFQLCIGILTAIGFDSIFTYRSDKMINEHRLRSQKMVIMFLGVFGILCIVYSLYFIGSNTFIVNKLSADGWGGLAETILQNRCRALWHAAFMFIFMAGILTALRCNPKSFVIKLLRLTIILVVVIDICLLATHYIKPMQNSLVRANPLISFLKSHAVNERVYVLSQTSFYHSWLTYLFPYHDIDTLNITQMPRMPVDYKMFLSTFSRNPMRIWELSAIHYILAPVTFWQNIQSNDALKEQFELVYSYNVQSSASGDVWVDEPLDGKLGAHVVVYFKNAYSRYSLMPEWTIANDQIVLANLTTGIGGTRSHVYIAPDNNIIASQSSDKSSSTGSIEVLNYRTGSVELKINTKTPCILRIAEKYDPSWKANIDGQDVSVLRCDYIFQGIYLDAGIHDVTVTYSPPSTAIWLQLFGLSLSLISLIRILTQKLKFNY